MRIILKSAFNMLKDNVFLNFVIILQLVITVFLINSLVNFYININYQHSIVESITTDELIYCVPGRNYVNIDEDVTKYRVSENNGEINGKSVYCKMLDAELLNYFKIPLHKGRWFTNESTEHMEIVVDANTNLSIGDIVDVAFTDVTNVKKSAIVVGILPSDYMFLRLSSGSTRMNLDHILRWNETDIDMPISNIYCNERILVDEGIFSISYNGHFIKLPNNLSDAERSATLERIKAKVQIVTVKAMKDSSEKMLKQKMLVGVPFCVLVFLLTFLSFGLMLMFINKRTIGYFSIMFLTGAKWRDIRWIVISYCIMVSVITLIINLIVSKFVINPFNIKLTSTNMLNNFLSIFIVLVVFMLSALGLTRKTINKGSIVEDLRRNE